MEIPLTISCETPVSLSIQQPGPRLTRSNWIAQISRLLYQSLLFDLLGLSAYSSEIFKLSSIEIRNGMLKIERTHDVSVKRTVVQSEHVAKLVSGCMPHVLEHHGRAVRLNRPYADIGREVHVNGCPIATDHSSSPGYVACHFAAGLLDFRLECHVDLRRLTCGHFV